MKFLFLIGASCLTSCLWSYPSVRSDFPGGNGRLEGVDEGSRTLTVRKEPKGSGAGRHYYFCFEVSGLEGKWTVRVVDTPSLTRMGPAVSTDGGETWRFLFDRPVPPPGVETFALPVRLEDRDDAAEVGHDGLVEREDVLADDGGDPVRLDGEVVVEQGLVFAVEEVEPSRDDLVVRFHRRVVCAFPVRG